MALLTAILPFDSGGVLNFMSGSMPAGGTFTRASAGTSTTMAGLVQNYGNNVPRFDHGLVYRNLLRYSNGFNNTSVWVPVNSSTLDAGMISPFGTRAWTLTSTQSSGRPEQSTTSGYGQLPIGTYNVSAYYKQGTSTFTLLRVDVGGRNYQATLNWVTMQATSTGTFGIGNLTLEAVGSNGWYRMSYDFEAQSVASAVVRLYTATDQDILVSSVQITAGSGVRPYSDNADDTLVGVYTPRGLLMEGQRTNLVIQNQNGFTGWGASNIAVFINQAGPDGNASAARLQVNNGATHRHGQTITVTPSTVYTASFYAKQGTMTEAKYSIYDVTNAADIVAPTSYISQINLNTFTRVIFTFTTPVGCTSIYFNDLVDSGVTGTITTALQQLEADNFASSVILTGGTSATRVQDAETFTDMAALGFNPTEGTILVEFEPSNWVGAGNAADKNLIRISNGTFSYGLFLYARVGDTMRFQVRNNSNDQALITTATTVKVGVNKAAITYGANNFHVCLNGGTVISDLSGVMPVVNQMTVGTNLYGTIRKVSFLSSMGNNLQGITT